MRAYFFGNMYLSSIQQGIQAAHVVAEMFTFYDVERTDPSNFSKVELLYEWARHHKTMILLNAGYSEELLSLIDFFTSNENPYPWTSFMESGQALEGVTTSAGIILPEKIYEAARQVRTSVGDAEVLDRTNELNVEFADGTYDICQFNDWEVKLINRLNNYGLAR